MTFGEWIRERAAELHLTHKQMLFTAGISSSNFYRYLNGGSPRVNTFTKIVRALDGDPAHVVKRLDEYQP